MTTLDRAARSIFLWQFVQAIGEFPGAVVLVSHDWHLLELVADRLWLVADATVRPFEGDLEDYERQVLEDARSGDALPPAQPDAASRRAARRIADETRKELEPLRQGARRAEEAIARLTKEREALDRVLAQPQGSKSKAFAVSDALKRRAELVRLRQDR